MYVWARLARTLATARARGPYRLGSESRLEFRCLPSDVDTNLHLNNARYMMLADLGRLDIFWRSGLLQMARSKGWAPMLGGLQTAYVREIRMWQRFRIISTIETWVDRQVIGQHRFELEDGRIAAIILTTGGIYDRGGRRFVPIAEALSRLGEGLEPPRQPTELELEFVATHGRLRGLAKDAP